MLVQTARLGKPFATRRASKSFLAGVDGEVLLQGGRVDVGLGAIRATHAGQGRLKYLTPIMLSIIW